MAWRRRTAVVVGLTAATSVGCATEREPVNRVQPHALEKSFFVGDDLADGFDDPEFYTAATVIDVPYGVQNGLFSGLAGGLTRIKWEITEEALLARRTYEHIEDVDGRGSRTTNNGLVVAAFPIDSHFDIRRDYNPQTGEETNVIEENTTDRPWYERRFMRVDWSRNLVNSSVSWDPLAVDYLFGPNYEVEPLAYYVEDPNNEDAPVFAPDEGYFDITQRLYVTPATITVEDLTLPTCFWRGTWVAGGDAETGVCESAEIKIRMSFKRIAHEGEEGFSDYLPEHYDGERMDAFGAFYVERKGFDPQYGVIDDRWFRFLQRYNIWQGSTTERACATAEQRANGVDPTLDEDHDGTHDVCAEEDPGSQCNVFRGRCTVPLARRELRPVAFHYHMGSDDEVLFEQTERAVEEWDTAVRLAVQSARYTECVRTRTASVRDIPAIGGAYLREPAQRHSDRLVRASCKTAFPIAGHAEDAGEVDGVELANVRRVLRCRRERGLDAEACVPDGAGADGPNGVAAMPATAVLCHNPVAESDHPACGEPGLRTRVGDIRYHSVNVWATPESSSPWGFGPSWADPLTGEVIQGSVNVYGAVTDLASRSVIDRARWFSGELTTDQVTSGDYVESWGGADSDAEYGHRFLLQPEEVERRLVGMYHSTAEAMARVPELNQSLDLYRQTQQLRQQFALNRVAPSAAGSNRAEFDHRIELAKDSDIEAQLVGPMWAEAAGIDPGAPLTGASLELASPLRLQNPERRMIARQAIMRRLAQSGFCMYEAPEPSATPALARLIERKFPALGPDASPGDEAERQERMFDYVRGRMQYGLILHEMGHTFGLRHNFAASADKYNYLPQYWQLRTNGGTTTELCTEPVQDGSRCIGPRYYDPESESEVEQSIHTWEHVSVMDYAGEYTQDWMGLGAYDLAAAKMIYGDVVSVRTDVLVSSRGATTPRAAALMELVSYPPGILGQPVHDGRHYLHCSEWQDFFGLLNECTTLDEVGPPDDWNAERWGPWDPVFDGQIVNSQICSRPPTDYVDWDDLAPDVIGDELGTASAFFQPRRPVDQDGRVRVPFLFEADEWVNGWIPSTQTRDVGADPYEQFIFLMNRYENDHIFENYRRNRVGFSIVDAYQRALERSHYKLAYLTQALSIYHDYVFAQVAASGTQLPDPDTGDLRPLSHAEIIALYEGEGRPLREHAIAASMAFDHFIRVLTRPHVGVHLGGVPGYGNLLVPESQPWAEPSGDFTETVVPNGTSRSGDDVTFGGRPLTNGFEYGHGYHTYDYFSRAGSYYEKTYAFQAMLNAAYRAPWSFSLSDARDARWRHTNFSNLFPEGIRRALGLMLTEDYELFAPRINAEEPLRGLGWVSFTDPEAVRTCWASNGAYVCRDPSGGSVLPGVEQGSDPVDPQLGYEIQKFIVFWAYVYLPSSQVLDWADQMRIYRTGLDQDPDYLPAERVAFRDPETSLRYVARRYGDEDILGVTYDRGIAAKMIQWAQRLVERAYELDPDDPYDPDTGEPHVALGDGGQPVVRADPSLRPDDPDHLGCGDNRACDQLRRYRGLLDFMRDTAAQLGFPEPGLQTVE